jgi:hypothetical protein
MACEVWPVTVVVETPLGDVGGSRTQDAIQHAIKPAKTGQYVRVAILMIFATPGNLPSSARLSLS